MNKKSILALGSLVGTIIGAGIFGVPYIMSKSGVIPSVFYFLILGVVAVFIYLAFSEIILRTNDKHRLVGYTGKYLGERAKKIVTVSIVVGTIGSLLAYIILGGKFLSIIFGGLAPFQFSIILWAVLFFFVYLGIKSIAPLEVILNGCLFGVFVLIFAFSFPEIKKINFDIFNKANLFVPFGVVLFSLLGWDAIPEIEGIFDNRKNLKKVIIIAIIVSVLFYLLFAFTVVGVTGFSTTEEPFTGLLPILGIKIILLGGLFGLLSVSTSILIGANYLKNTLVYDYNMNYRFAFGITAISPLIFFLLGFRDFITVISFVGVIVALIEGIAISMSWRESKKKGDRAPEYELKISRKFIYVVIFILVIGTLSQIISFL